MTEVSCGWEVHELAKPDGIHLVTTPSTPGEPMTPNANKDLVRSFVGAWNDRDFDRFAALMGEHAVLSVGGMTLPCNQAGTRSIAEEWPRRSPTGDSTCAP